MLNEVFLLSESLKRTGVTLHSWHRHFKKPSENSNFHLIRLSSKWIMAT